MSPFSACCVAGTRSGVGKTTLTIGLLSALRRRGRYVQPFKCGPDYIDPGYHRCACGVVSRNLDTWMMGEDGVRSSYARAVADADVAVVEGVMGLFDGASPERLEGSSAHVCKILDIPVVLVVDARAMARSIAPLVKGFAGFEPGVRVAGVVANNVASESHTRILREALKAAGLPPLLGAMPRRPEWRIPERHLGLIADTESGHTGSWFDLLADGVEEYVDIDTLVARCGATRPNVTARLNAAPDATPVRLGIARDAAFHFYYEDNLDLLRGAGVEVVEFSPLSDARLPDDLAGLYIGGGFPEMFAGALCGNAAMREAIARFAERGGLVYAECGGLMYLCKSLEDQDGKRWEMCGALPATTRMEPGLRRLGYVEASTLSEGIFGPPGTRLRGHEFHWSSLERTGAGLEPLFTVRFARNGREERAGFRGGNVCASYVHTHFASNPSVCRQWAERLREHAGGTQVR